MSRWKKQVNDRFLDLQLGQRELVNLLKSIDQKLTPRKHLEDCKHCGTEKAIEVTDPAPLVAAIVESVVESVQAKGKRG